MEPYLEPDDPEATRGLTKKEPLKDHSLKYLCPVCQGFGGWILKRDAYGPDQHFKCCCSQCNGWGYVSEHDRDCIHTWKRIPNTSGFRCMSSYACTKCGREVEYDSSD